MDNEKKLTIWYPLPHLCPVPPAGTEAPPPAPLKEGEKSGETAAETPAGATPEIPAGAKPSEQEGPLKEGKGGIMEEKKDFQAGEVTVSKTEPRQGESFDIIFTVKDGEPPYAYSITFPSDTNIQQIKGKSPQAEKIKETINVPESLKAGTELDPKIEVKDKNNKSVTFENIPKILVVLAEKNRTRPPGLPGFFRTGMETGVQLTGKLFPIVFLGIATLFLIMIAYNLGPKGTLLSQLSKPEVTRGFITFLIAFGTIAIAIMLVIAAFLASEENKDKTPLKERFDMGKGVLTALIGILGTIVGFYFGSAPATVPTIFQAGEVRVSNLEPKIGESFDLTFTVKDGEAPYTYSITFPHSSNITSIKDKVSQIKEIKETIKVPENAPETTDITPKIVVTDKYNKAITFEGKIPKIVVNGKPTGVVKEKPTGEVKVSNLEPKQGESFDITITVKDGDPPYTYSIAFPPNTFESVNNQTSQTKEIKATIQVPDKLAANTEVIPQKIEVTGKNKKSITLEKNLPKIVVKGK